MLLSKLLEGVQVKNYIDKKDVDIKSICLSTKDVKNDCLFFCLSGTQFDGHEFAEIAKQKGAKAIICERPLETDITQIVVEDSRIAMALIASNFYDNPTKKFKLIGITGTNGKTTTTYYIKNILEKAGFKVGVIGTIGTVIGDEKYPATLTTPDPIELYKIFNEMAKKNAQYVVMEVSAHAIYWNKIFGIKFDVGVLTNITQDHLDFFETFDKYKKVKQSFLNSEHCKNVVVNIDDEAGRELALSDEKVFSYGLHNPCDVFAFDYSFSFSGTEYGLNMFDDVEIIKTTQIGKFNLYNALCAATVCKVLGIDKKHIINGLETLSSVAGRINVLNLGGGKIAIIDYAHTPDGLKNILQTVREVCSGKVVSLFGCGGNRDKTKRSIMGEISAFFADYTIITSDNPRFENPQDIICEIENGVKKLTQKYICIEDRKKAINYGLKMLKENDCLVVCGKGAENYIDACGVKTYYSDYETIEKENKKIKEQQVD